MIESLINNEFELSTISFEVAPKCTYSPAPFSQTSVIDLDKAAISWFVAASISFILSNLTKSVLAFAEISSATS